ncbi:MAG TPA: cob(I)yrinic acid a,c-diamide adenosyltransferase [Armatimonadota bacterium]|jgi:cob(I)alamin adenosyltransferase
MWYTGTGDEGYTGLVGGERVAKDAPQIEALGDLDEANSAIGVARAFTVRAENQPLLLRVQRELYLLMAEIASPDPECLSRRIESDMIAELEADIALLGDASQRHIFIVPGDTRGGATLDLARSVVRRAERRVVHLTREGYVRNERLMRYLNRLSSLLFVLARAEDAATGIRSTSVQV